MKRVAAALWSSGELAIRERRGFQRTYDLAERVIPERRCGAGRCRRAEALEALLLRALEGHGWATTGTLAATWRLRNRRGRDHGARSRGCRRRGRSSRARSTPATVPARPRAGSGPTDLELAARLERRAAARRPRRAALAVRPVLWDRARVARLFGFDAVLEIFKPAPQRVYGYYCLPVLAGERLVARVDLKADRAKKRLRVLAAHYEEAPPAVVRRDRHAARGAVERYAAALGLAPAW